MFMMKIIYVHCESYIGYKPTLYFFLFPDLYQINMAYAHWKSEKREDRAVFDLFFRKNPFSGEFTIFAGLEECLKFLENFRYSESG